MSDSAAKAEKNKRLKGAPGWMITFADLMALLVALFVLILSFAEFDVDKFMKNTGPLAEAFNATHTPVPFTRLELGRSQQSTSDVARDDSGDRNIQWIQNALDELEATLAHEIQAGEVTVEDVVDGVVVRLGNLTAFKRGSSRLSLDAKDSLGRIANVILGIEGRVVVSGHTGDEPLQWSRFTSKWDLSAARAAAVVDFLAKSGQVESSRMMAQGLADSRPLNDGLNPADRAANQRVEILVTKSRELR